MQSTGITEMEPGFTELMIQRDRQRQSKSTCTQSNYELIDAGEVQDDNVCVCVVWGSSYFILSGHSWSGEADVSAEARRT